MEKNKNFKDNFFLYTLLPLLVIFIGVSFFRFIIKNDYLVTYEIDCDPSINSCFVGHDDETNEQYYYSQITKYAPEIYEECGSDITDCENANICLPNEPQCFIEYCEEDKFGINICSSPSLQKTVLPNNEELLLE